MNYPPNPTAMHEPKTTPELVAALILYGSKRVTDTTNLRRWIQELRSGKYEQGYYRLFTGDRQYSALGVWAYTNGRRRRHVPLMDSYLTREEIGNLLGVSPVVAGDSTCYYIIQLFVRMNDHYQMTFPETADIVEQMVMGIEENAKKS